MNNNVRKISIGSDYKNDAAMKYQIYYLTKLIILTIYSLKKTTRCCRGKSLIKTWQYPLSMT